MKLVITLSGVSPDTWAKEIISDSRVLGRAASADIRLEHSAISRNHCRFWADDGGTFVEDCGSLNGTYLNGRRIEKFGLSDGDKILVGPFELLIANKERLEPTHDFELPETDTEQTKIGIEGWPPERATLPFKDQEEEERHLVSLVHSRLTPTRRLTVPGLLIETAYAPSGMMGGDCFECFALNDRWMFAVFEPMNHGSKAAMTIMLLRIELQRWASLAMEPSRCLKQINDDLVAFGVSDLYICGCVGIWHPRTFTMVYSTAGQHPPLLLRGKRIVNLTATAGGLPLGITKGESFEEQLLELAPKDRVFFFTDGVGELIRARRATDTGPTIHMLADELLKRQKENLQTQVQKILKKRPDELLDDALLVGCEVTG